MEHPRPSAPAARLALRRGGTSPSRSTRSPGPSTERSIPMPAVPSPTPDRAALSGPLSGTTFLAALAGALSSADVPAPGAGADAVTIRRFCHGNRGSARLSAAGQLVSAAALGRFTASVVRLAGPGSGALPAAAAVRGSTAVGSLATSGVLTAALTTGRAESDDRAVAMHRRAFLAGGVAHGVG